MTKTLKEWEKEVEKICDRLGRVCMKYGRGDLSEEYPPTMAAYDLIKLFQSKLDQQRKSLIEEIEIKRKSISLPMSMEEVQETLTRIDYNQAIDDILNSLKPKQ